MVINDPTKVILANSGFMNINNILIAELKTLEIKLTPETKDIGIMNSMTKGEVNVSYKGDITFEINKVYSRFKPAMLECAKSSQSFTFNIEATAYTPDKKSEETIYISDCWTKGDLPLFTLKSDNDYVTEKYTAGFAIENSSFTDVIDDGQGDWVSLT